MSLQGIKYSAYGSRSFAGMDDPNNLTAHPDDPIDPHHVTPRVEQPTPKPGPKPYQPHLLPGCKPDPASGGFKYTKNGKSAVGSTCEIAKIAYDTKYPSYLDDIHDTKRTVKRINSYLHREYIFRGLVRCRNSSRFGCWREVVGRTPQEARENFCRLYGPCIGDPLRIVQIPISYIADSDRIHVIKIGDDDVSGGVAPSSVNGPITATVNINAPPTPPVVSQPGQTPASAAPADTTPDPTPAPAAGGSDFLNGNIGGIPTVMVVGGGIMLLLMMMVMRK